VSAARPEPKSALPADSLPAGYGTGRLWLTAREPRGLYAHYDPLVEAGSKPAGQALAPRLVLRICLGDLGGRVIAEAPMPPESRHCFVQVSQPGAAYVAELGHYGPDERWRRLAASQAAHTPPEGVSAQTAVQFASLPFPVERPGKAVAAATPPLVAPAQLVSPIFPDPPSAQWAGAPGPLLAVTANGGMAAEPAVTASILPASVDEVRADSSPTGGEAPAQEGFWFNLQADLVVHGAAAPGASVRIAGQAVPVRADGTFSVRFSLPDGEHLLPVEVVGAQGETRALTMAVRRDTRTPTAG